MRLKSPYSVIVAASKLVTVAVDPVTQGLFCASAKLDESPIEVSVFKSTYAIMNPSTLDATSQNTGLKGVIAVVGCDGTGKSTLTADLLIHLTKKGRAEKRYMGLVSGEAGDKIKQLPIVGVALERYLKAKAGRAQDMRKKLPGTGTAFIMHLFSIWRVGQLRKLMRLAESGVLVVVDRYPQAEITGFNYDGPGFDVTPSSGWFLRKLVTREKALYKWMSEQRPAMVIRLNIDAETAHARKPDHRMNELIDKSAIMPKLTYNGANIVDIDARLPYVEVLSAATSAIDGLLAPKSD